MASLYIFLILRLVSKSIVEYKNFTMSIGQKIVEEFSSNTGLTSQFYDSSVNN